MLLKKLDLFCEEVKNKLKTHSTKEDQIQNEDAGMCAGGGGCEGGMAPGGAPPPPAGGNIATVVNPPNQTPPPPPSCPPPPKPKAGIHTRNVGAIYSLAIPYGFYRRRPKKKRRKSKRK